MLYKSLATNHIQDPIVTGSVGVSVQTTPMIKPYVSQSEAISPAPPVDLGIESGINYTADTLNWDQRIPSWGMSSNVGRSTLTPNPGTQYGGNNPFNGKAVNNPTLPPWYDIAGIVTD